MMRRQANGMLAQFEMLHPNGTDKHHGAVPRNGGDTPTGEDMPGMERNTTIADRIRYCRQQPYEEADNKATNQLTTATQMGC